MLVLIWSDLANFNVIMKIKIISYILSILSLTIVSIQSDLAYFNQEEEEEKIILKFVHFVS